MKAIVTALVVTVAAVGLDAWLLRSEASRDVLTPSPEKVVQTFIGSLAAERPDVAREHVAEELRARVSSQDLRAYAADLRARHGEFRYEEASEQRDGDATEVRARLHTRRDGVVERQFRLTRDPETHLWKITALAPAATR